MALQLPSVTDAVALASSGRSREAAALIAALADGGDDDALYVQALWRLEGRLLPRDPTLARTELGAAAGRGHARAARVHAAFLAAGVGGERDWPGATASLDAWRDRDPLAARQAGLIGSMALTASGDPVTVPKGEPICERPQALRFPALLAPDECRFLIELAEARFKPAMIFHEAQQRFVRDPIRTSDAAGFPVVAEAPFVHAINRRLAAASGTAVDQGETLQLLRYRPRQEYKLHLDAIAGLANQRQLTFLVYLNDDYEGGETRFPEAGFAFRGGAGDGFLFRNALEDGRPDPFSRHAGDPVTSGTKYIASRWIRSRSPDDPERGFGQHEAEGR